MAVSFRVRGARGACGRRMRPQGVGRFETANRRRAYSPCGCCISRPPDAEQAAPDAPDALGTKNPPDCRRWVPLLEEFRRSLEASLHRPMSQVYLHLHAIGNVTLRSGSIHALVLVSQGLPSFDCDVPAVDCKIVEHLAKALYVICINVT